MTKFRELLMALLFIGMAGIAEGQSSDAIFISDEGRRGFIAMAPKNMRTNAYQKTDYGDGIPLRSKQYKVRRVRIKRTLPVNIHPNPRLHLKGPKAKNYKPWKRHANR